MTLEELAENARGDIDKIYLHWTGGHYNQTFRDYHICIIGSGKVMMMCDDLTEVKAHTWHRNSRAIGIALCCAYNATTNDLGPEPPTEDQLSVMAIIVAKLCHGLGIPINEETVMTHAEAADLDDYGPATTCERWDLWFLWNGEEKGSGGFWLRTLAKEVTHANA